MLSRWTRGFGIAFALTAVLSALLVVLKESSRGVFEWMTALTGHHWLTHGVLQMAVFVVLGLLFSAADSTRTTPTALVAWVAGGMTLGSLVIAGFFLLY